VSEKPASGLHVTLRGLSTPAGTPVNNPAANNGPPSCSTHAPYGQYVLRTHWYVGSAAIELVILYRILL